MNGVVVDPAFHDLPAPEPQHFDFGSLERSTRKNDVGRFNQRKVAHGDLSQIFEGSFRPQTIFPLENSDPFRTSLAPSNRVALNDCLLSSLQPMESPHPFSMGCWPEKIGLAQLHQLRGRVGRGETRAFAYLLTESNSEQSEKRLAVLEEFSRPGAGFAISERDLDLRGAGDLFSEQQSGHVQVLGPVLYSHLLKRALEKTDDRVADLWMPDLNLPLADMPAVGNRPARNLWSCCRARWRSRNVCQQGHEKPFERGEEFLEILDE